MSWRRFLFPLLAILVATLLYLQQDSKEKEPKRLGCPVIEKEFEVRGKSLEGIVSPGDKVIVEIGYYKCHPVMRGDVIAFLHPGKRDPIIKKAFVLPGDRFQLKEIKGAYHLFVNDEEAKTTDNKPFLFRQNSYKMLSLYERDFKGVMPKGLYFVFGALQGGGLDSTKFGPLGEERIYGRVRVRKDQEAY
jgi:signal peptidase I